MANHLQVAAARNTDLLVRQGRRQELIQRGLLPATASQAEADRRYREVQRDERKQARAQAKQQWDDDADPKMSFFIMLFVTVPLVLLAVAFSSTVMGWIAVWVGGACFFAWLSALNSSSKHNNQ